MMRRLLLCAATHSLDPLVASYNQPSFLPLPFRRIDGERRRLKGTTLREVPTRPSRAHLGHALRSSIEKRFELPPNLLCNFLYSRPSNSI